MGKDKLRRFAEAKTFGNMLEPEREDVVAGKFDMKGDWAKRQFKNNNPLILELGCGHGDYTIGLARKYPDKNFIGLDIKGARMWRGAKIAITEGLQNVAFLRVDIELIENCFTENEVSEIWITFPDPQIKYKRAKHRLVHPNFLAAYQHILLPEGKIHLKCDSEFLHGYACGLIQMMEWPVHAAYYDIHKQLPYDAENVLFAIQTHYEKRWISEGKAITYLCFSPPA
jgi:tRNA (guanine-N7-)-methyltransferase